MIIPPQLSICVSLGSGIGTALWNYIFHRGRMSIQEALAIGVLTFFVCLGVCSLFNMFS